MTAVSTRDGTSSSRALVPDSLIDSRIDPVVHRHEPLARPAVLHGDKATLLDPVSPDLTGRRRSA